MEELCAEFEGVDEFFDSVRNPYKGIAFKDFTLGVLASDTVDSQNEIMSLDSLKAIARDVNNGVSIAGNPNHDPRIPPCGRTLRAKLIANKDGSKHFVFVVLGSYSKEYYKPFPSIPESESIVSDSPSNYSYENIKIGFNKHEIDESVISDALDEAPQFVARKPDRQIRKAQDPIAILQIVIPAMFVYPFVRRYMEKSGELVAEKQKEFLGWLFRKLLKRINRRVLYQFDSPYKGCEVKFIIETNKGDNIDQAFEDILNASTRSVSIINALAKDEPTELVYVYDHENTKRWVPCYLRTKDEQVFTDKPYLKSIERFGGLSIEGRHRE